MSTVFSLTFVEEGPASVAAGLSAATPTDLLLVPTSASRQEDGEESRKSVMVGCDDGSIYLLRSKASLGDPGNSTNTVLEVSPVSPLLSSRRNPRRPSSARSSARSLSPASAKSPYTPFHVSKPRVVSSVSTQQAEAPKNYVDFDDEQEKMKNMLKRKGVKDKTVMDSIMPVADKAFPADKCVDPSATTTPKDDYLSSGTPLSPASSTHSLSRPSSSSNIPNLVLPKSLERTTWSLICHTVPPKRAQLTHVTSLKAIDKHSLALCLHESGEVGVYSLVDGSCQASTSTEEGVFSIPTGAKPISKLPLIWHWKSLHIVPCGKSFVVVACAISEATTSTIQSSESENHTENTRLAAFELEIEREGDSEGISLTKTGDWMLEGPMPGVALHASSDGRINLLHINGSKHLIKQHVSLTKKVLGTDSPLPIAGSTTHLPLSNPFKALKGLQSAEKLEEEQEDPLTEIELVEPLDLGLLPLNGSLTGIRFDSIEYLASGLAWSEQELLLFDVSTLSVQVLGVVQLPDIVNVLRHDHNLLTLQFKDHVELRRLDALHAKDNSSPTSHAINSSSIQSYPLSDVDVAVIPTPTECIFTRMKNGRRRIESQLLSLTSADPLPKHLLWKITRAEMKEADKAASTRLSAALPLELNHMLLGYADGFLQTSSLTSLIQRKSRSLSGPTPMAGAITRIHVVRLEKSANRRIIVGADDGSIGILAFQSLQLLARWTVFIEPLNEVIHVPAGRLQDCVFCVSQDGSIAVIAPDGCEFLYLIPASIAPLQMICLAEDNLLLAYADQRARLWDIKTREFWRSMSTEKAEEMTCQGGWQKWSLHASSFPPNSISSMSNSTHLLDAGATLTVDLDEVLLSLNVGPLHVDPMAGHTNDRNDFEAKRIYLRSLVSSLLTNGLNADIDHLCQEKLETRQVLIGLCRSGSTSIYTMTGARDPWSISPDVSALRVTSIVAVLHALVPFDDKPDAIETITSFYNASVGPIVGSDYEAPSLTALARVWLRAKSADLRFAARQLFEAGVTRLPDDQINLLVDSWSAHLPCSQSEARRDSTTSALALYICGSVAVNKYTLLPSIALTDIAKSISLYLHDEHSPHRALAIDLCSRGFPVWQQHVDAVEILRSLFALATSSRKDTGFNVGQQARSAVLLIASGNSPLFMTTVSMDILQPKSVQHRKSVMQLVIFLIHKRPLVLYSNLPRLVEAVVKSLDPNSNANRDAVLDSATEILGHLVETYPILDFHGPSQRLAIGTSEGAVVMYDLKTATRLYVLEGHIKRTTACAFSPDGRRLVTLSLEEHTVLVWKVGSSFTSFFMPGAPPRQGHGGSEPYKTYDFNIGDEGEMTLAATLELVKFEWPSDRSVRIRIRGATLTFST